MRDKLQSLKNTLYNTKKKRAYLHFECRCANLVFYVFLRQLSLPYFKIKRLYLIFFYLK